MTTSPVDSMPVVLRAADQPGVLRRVAGVFEEHGVSIETLRQVPSEREDAPGASLRLITHRARQRDLDATVEALAALDVVRGLVEAHEGQMTVGRSRHGGALFRFTLPGGEPVHMR